MIVVIYVGFCLVFLVGLGALTNLHRVSEGRLSWAGYTWMLVEGAIELVAVSAASLGVAWLLWKVMNPRTRLVLGRKRRPAGSPGPDEGAGGR